jgi:hypothetical protein
MSTKYNLQYFLVISETCWRSKGDSNRRYSRLSSNNIAQKRLAFGYDRSVTGGDLERVRRASGSGPARRFACAGLRWCGGWRRKTSEDPMFKVRSKSKPAARKHTRKSTGPKPRRRSLPVSPRAETRSDTKHARMIAMLRAPAGATIAAIMNATGWQQHSVRGFLAGVVRRKLGLNLLSEPTDQGRIYRIRGGKASAAADRSKQAVA